MDSNRNKHKRGLMVFMLVCLLSVGVMLLPKTAQAQEDDAVGVASTGELSGQDTAAGADDGNKSQGSQDTQGSVAAPANDPTDGVTEGAVDVPAEDDASGVGGAEEQIIQNPTDGNQTDAGIAQTGETSYEEVGSNGSEVAEVNAGDSGEPASEAQVESQATSEVGSQSPSGTAPQGASDATLQSTSTAVPQGTSKAVSKSASGVGREDDSEEGDNQQEIPNASYTFSSALNRKKVLSVKNDSSKSGANVNISESVGLSGQRWDVRYVMNNLYRIFKHGTNLVLTVLGGQAKNNANVVLATNKNLSSQLWSFARIRGQYYSISSYLNPNFVLDVKGGKTADGTNVRLRKKDSSKAQQFKLYNADPATSSSVALDNGTYTLRTTGNTSYSVAIKSDSKENDANVQLSGANNNIQQKFHIDSDGAGYYIISSVNSGKVLSVKNGSVVPTNNVVQKAYNGSDTQKWAIHKTSFGYVFVNKATKLTLEVSGAKFAKGTNVRANVRTDSTAQSYQLNRVYLLSEGISKITSAKNGSKVMEIKGASAKNGATVQINADSGALCQRFEIQRIGLDGQELYRIRTAASGGFLTFVNGKVVQYGSSKTARTDANTWSLVWNGSSYSLKNVASGKVLALRSGKTANRTAIVLARADGGVAQHFSYLRTNLISSGSYIINTSTKKSLEVSGSSKQNGAGIRTNTKKYKLSEWFNIKGTDSTSNVYVIKNMNSGKAMSVASTSNGAKVTQQKYNKSASQKWEARIADGGYVVFVNTNSGKALTVGGGKSSANARQETVTGSNGQNWKLQPIGWVAAGEKYYYYFPSGKATPYVKSVYTSWTKIKNRKSSKNYMAALDRNHTYTTLFKKLSSVGVWAPYKAFTCSVGAHSTPTPAGLHKVWHKSTHQYYVDENNGVTSSVFYWTNFGPQGQAFHSVLYFAGTNRVSYGALGKWNSHGCVRCPYKMAKLLYSKLAKGSLVYVY